MRPSLLAAGLLAAVLPLAAVPQSAMAAPKTKHPAAAPAAAAVNPKDVVVASVAGHAIHLSDLDAAVAELPQQARALPPAQLYPLLIDQLVDREALVIEARKQNLQAQPDVQKAIANAADQVLQNALLRQDLRPQINDAALHAMYDKEIGSKPGEEQVQASHILVKTKDEADKIIAQVKGGADFATLAKKYSTDPTGAQSGGDLGWFKRGDMLPAFSQAAFALQPGQYTQAPVQTQYGWHVIKVFNRRLAPPPSFAESQQQLQQELIQKLVQQEVAKAKQTLTVQKFNSDGSVASGTPALIQPPAPAGAPATTAPAAPAPK